ncbi:MAG TPA: type I-E CRISPR-associated protein Cse2/CasB [Dongiaceae bacterium]|nr:type I-E CRISPR-associated protein Cse2/CasB [Dongiaceae bacterium]
MEQQRLPDFMALYHAWEQLKNGPKAELRRVAKPEELLEVPTFYRLFSGKAHAEWEKQAYQRLIFCLPYIRHTNDSVGLGKALTRGKSVSEKRLFQVVRSDAPNDMIQLRRIVQMVEPSVNWSLAAKTLWYWNDRSKRDLLEDYFLNQPK